MNTVKSSEGLLEWQNTILSTCNIGNADNCIVNYVLCSRQLTIKDPAHDGIKQ
jgi:hypothetical protein